MVIMNEADNISSNSKTIIFSLFHAEALQMKYFDFEPEKSGKNKKCDHVATFERRPMTNKNKTEYENIEHNIMREIV